MAFEEHLAGCERCREEIAGLSGAAEALAYASGPAEPPPELRDRILVAARAERPNVVPLRPRWAYAIAAVAAVAACAAVGLGIWNVSLHDHLCAPIGAAISPQSTECVGGGNSTPPSCVLPHRSGGGRRTGAQTPREGETEIPRTRLAQSSQRWGPFRCSAVAPPLPNSRRPPLRAWENAGARYESTQHPRTPGGHAHALRFPLPLWRTIVAGQPPFDFVTFASIPMRKRVPTVKVDQ